MALLGPEYSGQLRNTVSTGAMGELSGGNRTCTGTRLLTRVAPAQVCGCADGEVGWGPTGQGAGHPKGWRGHRPAGRGLLVTRSGGGEFSRGWETGSSGLYPVILQTGVGEVVLPHEPDLGAKRNYLPESRRPPAQVSGMVTEKEWGT